jgi:hypothetical protein
VLNNCALFALFCLRKFTVVPLPSSLLFILFRCHFCFHSFSYQPSLSFSFNYLSSHSFFITHFPWPSFFSSFILLRLFLLPYHSFSLAFILLSHSLSLAPVLLYHSFFLDFILLASYSPPPSFFFIIVFSCFWCNTSFSSLYFAQLNTSVFCVTYFFFKHYLALLGILHSCSFF